IKIQAINWTERFKKRGKKAYLNSYSLDIDKLKENCKVKIFNSPNIQFSEIEISAQNALTITNLEVGYYYSLLPKLNFSVDGGQK
ncbi:hypothetical protein ACTPEM_25165, partial [Clostridioides difficile]